MKKLFFATIITLVCIMNQVPSGDCNDNSGWRPITGNQFNMVAYGQVFINQAETTNPRYLLGAFGSGGENDCRAVGKLGVSTVGFYLTIRGNINGESIKFKLYDTATGDVFDIYEKIRFEADGIERNLDLSVQ